MTTANGTNETPYENSTPRQILLAATQLFALYGFDAVSVKQIAELAGANSALISYYYGGKRHLYLEVLNTQMEAFQHIIAEVQNLNDSPRKKLQKYVNDLCAFQATSPNSVQLIFREILSPQPTCEEFVKNKLYILHTFMTKLVAESITAGEMHTKMAPTHVAFTVEGIILFYFLMHKEVRELGKFAYGQEMDYLRTAINSYLESIS